MSSRLISAVYDPAAAGSSTDAASGRNMQLLMQLRWLAVLGQLATILIVHVGLGVRLPLAPMMAVLAWLVTLNLLTRAVMRWRVVTNLELFLALLLDVVALSAQLYMSGGATNPFVSLYLLQVVLGAVLLDIWSAWTLAILTSVAFGLLAMVHRPLLLPPEIAGQAAGLHVFGSWLNFVLAAFLMVQFVMRIGRNLKSRDVHLAELRQQASEEDHIVRMGLLASGAAHELSTPLASLSVIVGDWKGEPAIARDPRLAEEVAEMQAELKRCKAIVTGILYASGEVRGEAPALTQLRPFLTEIVANWDSVRPGLVAFEERLGAPLSIVADPTLAQVLGNILDNAAEAGASRIGFIAERNTENLILTIVDDGSGFPDDLLATAGTPYRTSKDEAGGLGLFLAVTTLRKLGGSVTVGNRTEGGAVVTLTIPLAALAFEGKKHG